MKTILASALVASAALSGAVAFASPANAVESWWNGKFISNGSYCNAGATGCQLKIDIGPADCRPFVGEDLNYCINHSTTRVYKYPVVWRSAKVWYCEANGVWTGTRIDATGVIAKLNGAPVTIAYGSTSDNKTDFVRCNYS